MVRVNGPFGSIGRISDVGERHRAADEVPVGRSEAYLHEHDSFSPAASALRAPASLKSARSESTKVLLKELDNPFPDWKFVDALLDRDDVDKARVFARVNAKGKDDTTLLHRVCYGDDPIAVIVLKKAGAIIDALNKQGSTPLVHAAVSGNKKVIVALAKAGANVNAKGTDENTPLHHAAYNGKAGVIVALLEAGADVNAVNKFGYTPLHHAASQGWADAILALAKGGAYTNAKTKSGDTALEHAVLKNNVEAILALATAGADFDIQDTYGYTARDAKDAKTKDAVAEAEKLQAERRFSLLGAGPVSSFLGRLPGDVKGLIADFVDGKKGASSLATAARIGDVERLRHLISEHLIFIRKLPVEEHIDALERLAKEVSKGTPDRDKLARFAASMEDSSPADLADAFWLMQKAAQP